MPDTIYALDTENYYDAQISIVEMGAWKYARASENYMLTIAGSDGTRYAGNPRDFDWGILRGKTIVMANAGYDLTVLAAEGEKGNIPTDLGFKEVVDVLDMSRYMGRPGSLAGASQSLLGIEVDKKTRSNMKGKQWAAMSEEFKKEVTDYAIKDAEITLRLWIEHGDNWPWHERELSRQTREIGMRGVPVDLAKAHEYKRHLEGLIWEAEQKIPWAKEDDAKILSPKALAEECRKVNIEPPKSLAVDSEDCIKWEDEYGESYPWVGAMRDWRRCNMLLRKVCTFINRTKPDGWMPFSLKYFGAGSTGRWSGDAGLNLQNLNRKELYGVDLRGLIRAPQGYKIISCDLAQIEPRCCGPTTLIFTDSGYKFITDLTPIDKVWDGCEFVSHEGVIEKTAPQTNSRLGHQFTDDHLIFTGEDSVCASATVCPKEAFNFRNPSWSEVGRLVRFTASNLIREISKKVLLSLSAMRDREKRHRGRYSKWGV